MSVKRKPYTTYSKEFKLEAIRLMNETENQWGQTRLIFDR